MCIVVLVDISIIAGISGIVVDVIEVVVVVVFRADLAVSKPDAE